MPVSGSDNPIKALPILKSDRTVLFCEAFKSPLGGLYLIFGGSSLAGIFFENPHIRAGKAPKSFKKELAEYFGGRLRDFSQEIAFAQGTEFERAVWLALKKIPYGQTRSYKWLAEQVGKPSASRAVGQALAKNPIPIVLPCHRIIEADGRIGGYTPGIDIKRRLLALEYYHLQT